MRSRNSMMCIEVSPTMSRLYLSTSRTSSSSFPTRVLKPVSVWGISLPQHLPSTATQSTIHQTLATPPVGGEPIRGWSHIVALGFAWPGPMGKVLSTRHLQTSPHTQRPLLPQGLAPGWGICFSVPGEVSGSLVFSFIRIY